MTRLLPQRPSLEQLKHQAKELRKAFHAGDPDATRRATEHLPGLTRKEAGPFSLSNAQYVVAREYSFASWPKLKHYLQALPAEVVQPAPAAGVQAPATRPKHAHLLMMAEHLRRKPHVVELTEQLVALAAAHATGDLLERLGRKPARLILAVRANVVERGHYPALRDAIVAGLEHPRPKVRQQAANLLDLFADSTCVAALRRAVEDPVPRVRRVAFHALTCDDCKLAPLQADADLTALRIQHALGDPNLRVRREVAAGLGEVCYDPRVVAALQTILATDTDEALRAHARAALEQQRRKA